jgi:putative ABC transport system permease protein
MRGWMADVRWALRLLARRPAFAATVILTLAVAFSAVASAYGIATAVLWRPLPFAQPDRLVFVWENSATDGAVSASRVTGFRFDQWVRGSRSLESMALFGSIGFLADQGNGAVIVHGARVSSNYFETLGISPVIGRGFAPSDSEPGQGQVVVLSHSLWTEWFGGRPDVIDRKIQLGRRPYTVIGVMPPVVFPAWPVNPAAVTLHSESRRLWVPITRTAAVTTTARAHVFGVVGRLREGVSMEAAQSELSQLTSTSDPDPHRALLRPFRDQFVRDARTPLIALIGAALAVLLVACTNLAALQGSSVEARRAELSVRAALGAGRARLARQFATEAVILVMCGGALALAASHIMLLRVPKLLPPSVPLLTMPSVNQEIVLLVVVMSVAATLALTAWPLAHARTSTSPAPRGNPPLARSLVFRGLVVAQIALAMALVAVAALLQRSLNTVRAQDAGFTIDRVLVGDVTLAGTAYRDPAGIVAGERRLASELAALPGATAVAFSYDHPLEANWSDSFALSGSAAAPDDIRGSAELRIVSPAYFATMQVEVLDGRALMEQDDLGATGAVVVNEAFARTVVDGPVLDRTLRSSSPRMSWNDPRVPTEFRIVGVVEDERFKGLEQPSAPAVYMSTRQFPQGQLVMLIRTAGDPGAIAGGARETVKRFDPQVPVGTLSPLTSILADQLVARRATTQVIDGFAAAGLGLAALGLYGLLALLVAGRMRETGIRLALGSSPAIEAVRVVRVCIISTSAGVACGLGLAMVAGRLVEGLLVGVSGRDALTLSVVSATMMGVAFVAASLPAWRAARVDPASVLRGEG